ncbi:acyloxyacyl hydrolase [Nitratireductor sp. GCM10026969]|uniref:acyloxyacyl hydrolase n=1 Tax=Nitratireductor sp. GCM10026969 TaxID=3252645 RepID=UPI00360E5CEE
MTNLRLFSPLTALLLLTSAFSATAEDLQAPSSFLEFGRNADRWEARAGGAIYDFGPFTPQSFSGGVINGELLAPSPKFLHGIGAPRPYIGTDIAISDDPIHVFYAGLNWEAYVSRKVYFGFSAGGAALSRRAETNDEGEEKDLGSQVLFHLQASAGVDLTENLTAQVYFNHFSNAQLGESNDGLESVGVRLGFRF